MPPSESPSFAAALISAIIAASAAGVEAAHLRRVDLGEIGRCRAVVGLGDTAPSCTTCESTSMPSWRSSALASARRDTGRRLARRRPLEHVAGVGEAVLLHAGQIGVAGPGLGERRLGRAVLGAGDISSCHLSGLASHSVLPISMATGEPSVRPWRTPPMIVSSSCSKRIRGPRP